MNKIILLHMNGTSINLHEYCNGGRKYKILDDLGWFFGFVSQNFALTHFSWVYASALRSYIDKY